MSDSQNNATEQDDASQTDAQQADASEDGDQSLADADLEQPSTGYEPGEEPKSSEGDDDDDEPSHEAVGIGIVETPPLEDGDNA